MLSFLGTKVTTSSTTTPNVPTMTEQQQKQQKVDEICAVWTLLHEKNLIRHDYDDNNVDDDEGDADIDGDENEEPVIVTRELLETTLVPVLRDELNLIDEEREARNDKDRRHDESGEEGTKLGKSESGNVSESLPLSEQWLVTAILECFLQFVIAHSTKDDKAFFVTSGALEETRHVLKQQSLLLCSPTAAPTSVTMPSSEILLGLEIVAHLTTDSSDALKNDHILPWVPLVHQLMEGSLLVIPANGNGPVEKDSEASCDGRDSRMKRPRRRRRRRELVQVYGCQILRHLSNPLLQELVVAGSVTVLARAMYECVDEAKVQEHGNATLYNLLPLCPITYLVREDPQPCASTSNQNNQQSRPDDDPSLPLPVSLLTVVVRGMQAHPHDWKVQQYGLLVLKRICQKDTEQFEWMVSEGGLSVVLTVLSELTAKPLVAKTTTTTTSRPPIVTSSPGLAPSSPSKKKDCVEGTDDGECFAQLASQFLKDLSRLSNYGNDGGNSNTHGSNNNLSSNSQSQHNHYQMDMVRIVAIKGGLHAMVQVLAKYSNNPNICDPALSCLRNLLVHPETRQQALDPIFVSVDTATDDQCTGYSNGETTAAIYVIPTIHQCMMAQPQDAAIQAYACDILGRLAQFQAEARKQIVAARGPGRDDCGETGGNASSVVSAGADMPTSLVATILRAMVTHRSHAGVQDRAVVVLVALMKGRGESSLTFPTRGTAAVMEQLEPAFEALQPKWGDHDVIIEDDLRSFFRACKVPPRGVAQLTELLIIVRDYYAHKSGDEQHEDGDGPSSTPSGKKGNAASTAAVTPKLTETSPRSILSFSFASLSSSSSHTPSPAPTEETTGSLAGMETPQSNEAAKSTGSFFFSPDGWKRKLQFANA